MVYNHRDFWQQGHRAKGLDPAILTPQDEIEFDDGTRIPAFAKLAFGRPRYHGPFRQMTAIQADAVSTFERGRGGINVGRGYVRDVRADGVAVVVEPYGLYAPGVYLVTPTGSVRRIDPPYGNGDDRQHA